MMMQGKRITKAHWRKALAATLAAGLALGHAPATAQDAQGEEELVQPEVVREYEPLSEERLFNMVPSHPGYLGALAPANLNAERPPAPFNVTGTWFIDLSEGFLHYLFGPPYPQFGPEGIEALIDSAKARENGETYRDAIGQCSIANQPAVEPTSPPAQ